MRTARLFLLAALALGCQQAAAQAAVPPALEVQRLAPQLVAFAGSPANFQNLVTGLSQGTPVQLVTLLPDGSTQLVTFTPAAPMPVAEIVQALETTRQRLIGLGIATPTAEQLATALTGGVVPTALGGAAVAGALGAQNPPSPAAQIQRGLAGSAGTAAGGTAPGGVSAQVFPQPPRIHTSDSPIPAGATSRSPAPAASAAPAAPAPAPMRIPPASRP